MREYGTQIRYGVAAVALLAGLILSIRLSERGFLLDPAGAEALASGPATPDGYDLSQLAIMNRVLISMSESYVDPARIEPHKMLLHALDRVQSTVPEVVALFDRDLEDSPQTVEVRVGETSQSYDISQITSHWELSFKLREIFIFLEEYIDSAETDLQSVEYAAINGMLSTLDPHSVLLNPDLYENMQASNRGSIGGVGIVISIRDGKLTVISPVEDTPAWRAGFQTGDHIIKINDESTINMPLDEAVSRLRGDPGDDVTVEIEREGWLEPHEFTLTREVISLDSVKHHSLGDGIGYIALTGFQGNTHADMMEALTELSEQHGPLRGLVLDLRNNPGGLLRQAIQITDTFLQRGNIVTTVGVGNRLREQMPASPAGTQPDYPIVVLVNQGSASASEIVAGALKNHNRALIIGDTTFGKGSVQNIYPFRDGSALKLTIAQYLTPGDVSIQGVGIVPDIRILPVSITEDSIDLYAGIHVTREGDLSESLTNERARNPDSRPEYVVKYLREEEEEDRDTIRQPNDFEVDFEIDFARQVLLETNGSADRSALLGRARDVIESTTDEQTLAIQERLRRRNVDWARGENIRQPVEVSMTTGNSSNRVNAGESIEVTLHATNRGQRALHQVRAVSDSGYGPLDDVEFIFGRIEPGETRSWTVSIEAPVEDGSRYETVEFHLWAGEVDLEQSHESAMNVVGQPRPHFGFSWWVDDSEGGNGDGMLQVGEDVKFHVRVSNTGPGDAQETIVYIRNESEAALFLRSGRETVEQLTAGAHHESVFEFQVNQRPESGTVGIDVELFDTVFREFLGEEVELPVTLASPLTVTPQTGHLVVTAQRAPMYAAASTETRRVAEAMRDAILTTDRRAGGLYHARWDGGEGWIPEGAATFNPDPASPIGEVHSSLQYQAPIIDLDHTILETNNPSFDVRGVVSDDVSVRDMYVVVTSRVDGRRQQSSKRAYSYLGVASANFTERVELRPGSNRITVVARDEDKITSTADLHVFVHD